MVEQNGTDNCDVCGYVGSVLEAKGPDLVCFGKPMLLMEEKIEDGGKEKHVPVIEKTETGVLVKVGSVEHPMEEKHYIEWIEIFADGKTYRKFLNPNDKPEAEFSVVADSIAATEFCNLHGLWKA